MYNIAAKPADDSQATPSSQKNCRCSIGGGKKKRGPSCEDLRELRISLMRVSKVVAPWLTQSIVEDNGNSLAIVSADLGFSVTLVHSLAVGF